jgi:O-antigen/teichoic acid export membrane protein/peptidoglycan/xylan/chitin deacetylase (PgdA/CDA1 family)
MEAMVFDSLANTECTPMDHRIAGARTTAGGLDGVERFRTKQVTSWMPLRRIRWQLTLLISWLTRILFGSKYADRIGILMYHRVASPPGRGPAPTWNVSPKQFRKQLTWLIERGYHPMALRKLLRMLKANEPIPPRSFVVTFDDGYENVFRDAFPILLELEVPATIFLATKYLDQDQPFPFDDWELAGSQEVPAATWRPLTTAQCKAMLDSGLVDLGSHTHTHENFLGHPEGFKLDLLLSLQFLADTFGIEDSPFAYPFGVVDGALAEVVAEQQLCCALGTTPFPAVATASPLTWGRLDASQQGAPWQLAIRLDGWYRLIEESWKRWVQRIPSASLVAMMDQIIVSGGSFVAAFLLGRASPTELAIYYLAVQCLWILRSVQNHLVVFPMKVFAPQTPETDARENHRLLTGFESLNRHLAFSAAVAGLGIAVLFYWMVPNPELAPVFAILSFAAPLYLQREFTRQRAFACLQPAHALMIDGITIATQIAGMLAIAYFQPLNAILVFAWIAVANLLGMLDGFPRGENISHRPVASIESTRPDWRMAWNFGKWNLATDALTSFMILALSWIVKSQKGLQETGLLAAAVIPVSLAAIIVNGYLNIQLPKATHAWNREGSAGLRRELRRLGYVLAGTHGLLILGMLVLGHILFEGFYGKGYERSVVVATMSLTSSLLGTVGFVAGTGLALIRQGKINFHTEIVQLIIAVATTLMLVDRWGAIAVPIATSVAVMIGGPVRYWQFIQHLRSFDLSKSKVIS